MVIVTHESYDSVLVGTGKQRGVLNAARGGLRRLAVWHLTGGPVGPPARWAATSNVEERVGPRGP